MSAVTPKLTRQAFREIYADRKPNWELIDGEPEQKALGSKRHSFLQVILAAMLMELGFRSYVELTLEISEDWEPVPDVAGLLGPDTDADAVYQNSPPAVAIEILSPSDRFSTLVRKCRRYADWGIPDILVFDPAEEMAWHWDGNLDALVPVREQYEFMNKSGRLSVVEAFRRLRDEMGGKP